MTVSLLLDTNIGTDVDDALALEFALRHPANPVAAAGPAATTSKSPPGIGGDPPPGGRLAEMGHEVKGAAGARRTAAGL
jgi:hypothetical protein